MKTPNQTRSLLLSPPITSPLRLDALHSRAAAPVGAPPDHGVRVAIVQRPPSDQLAMKVEALSLGVGEQRVDIFLLLSLSLSDQGRRKALVVLGVDGHLDDGGVRVVQPEAAEGGTAQEAAAARAQERGGMQLLPGGRARVTGRPRGLTRVSGHCSKHLRKQRVHTLQGQETQLLDVFSYAFDNFPRQK